MYHPIRPWGFWTGSCDPRSVVSSRYDLFPLCFWSTFSSSERLELGFSSVQWSCGRSESDHMRCRFCTWRHMSESRRRKRDTSVELEPDGGLGRLHKSVYRVQTAATSSRACPVYLPGTWLSLIVNPDCPSHSLLQCTVLGSLANKFLIFSLEENYFCLNSQNTTPNPAAKRVACNASWRRISPCQEECMDPKSDFPPPNLLKLVAESHAPPVAFGQEYLWKWPPHLHIQYRLGSFAWPRLDP